MKPRIGISCDVVAGNPPRATVPLTYVDFVRRWGASPLILPPDRSATELLDLVDGVIVIGGDDYRLGNHHGIPEEFVAVEERREETDVHLMEDVLRRDLPFLGVCAGFQLVALVGGGTIYGDLSSEGPASDVRHKKARPEDSVVSHPLIWLEEDSVCGLSPGTHSINSHHHQAVREVPAGWRVLAEAPDGVIEAAAGPGRFQVGVQWHPERAVDCVVSDRIGESFVRSAQQVRAK